ncbi:MAG TPA: GNAT family N-acetyltransferase [Niabella sp.]|nr:GNAT family N-acetyltransferase [Niabella sp.]HOZ97734.1 GNAT family N-acetyltransferase [Niabella sp.]HQW14049.1 GNAT family N-acetyltransferase [Niabella sp.]HQX19408.1 GNAT family N-acetyltransferase [Niabella sp.]HQX40239.1 GNAT family N-acetyltransferase [Niabella sp.]
MKFKTVDCIIKDGSKVRIREAMPKDAQELIKCISSYILQSDNLISTIEEFNPTLYQQEDWINLLTRRENSILLVAEYNGKIIGNVDLKGESRKRISHNALLGIGILKGWQQLGLGTALLRNVIDWARNNVAIENIGLNVFEGHSQAIYLYEKAGFQKVGIQSNYIRKDDGTYANNIMMQICVK